jgi:signal transduction histidine kinase
MVTAMNAALQQMLGDGSKAGFGQRLVDVIDPQDRLKTERLLAELFEGKLEILQADSRSTGKNGRAMHWTAWRVSEPFSGIGPVLAIAECSGGGAAGEDRAASDNHLQIVGRMAGGVAHDFNNLLTGMLLHCDLLMASLEPGHRARKHVEEIRSVGLETSALVRQLLAVARPAAVQPHLLLLNDVVERVRSLLLRLIGEDIRIEFHLDPSLSLVRADATQAQQVLLNLALNARDAMPEGGEIRIETRNCRLEALDAGGSRGERLFLPCVLLAVEDSGCGMDAATQEHMFEPFFTTKAGKGTGLGLATVHEIVTTSGGIVSVRSQPGRGTRITVLLPAAVAVPESEGLAEQISESESLLHQEGQTP